MDYNKFLTNRDGDLFVMDGKFFREANTDEKLFYIKNYLAETKSKKNIITITDSYKFSHYLQYPPKTQHVYSYFESRTGAKFNETVFFGLQYLLKEYLAGPVVTKRKIDEAEELVNAHMGRKGLFNRKGWEGILYKHDGRLPVRIKAVPEGTPVTVSNVLMTVENTDPEFYWLTNYLETLLVQVWFPNAVATQVREIKKIIKSYLLETGDVSLIDFKYHCFAYRGVSSVESAGWGNAAHLSSFFGTDTVRGLEFVRDYYNSGIVGFSIPASEHSTITSWGREHEDSAMENMLNKYPDGLVACVSDSFDIYNACANIWGDKLRGKVLAREGCLVIRPDSGDAKKILPDIIKILGDKFGFTKNDKGYFVLNPKVRVIQGDGVNINSLKEILEVLKQNQLSADNIAFGSGGANLQKLDRDTQKNAFKCSSITIDGEEREVFKQPITDPGKNSKKGRLALIKTDKGYETVSGPNENDILQVVFEDGEIKKEYNFEEVRNNAKL